MRILSMRCDHGLMPVASTKRPVLNHETDCGPKTAAVAYHNKRAPRKGERKVRKRRESSKERSSDVAYVVQAVSGVCRGREGRKGGGTAPWARFLIEVPWNFVKVCVSYVGMRRGKRGTYFR